jgi:hypothetical protein
MTFGGKGLQSMARDRGVLKLNQYTVGRIYCMLIEVCRVARLMTELCWFYVCNFEEIEWVNSRWKIYKALLIYVSDWASECCICNRANVYAGFVSSSLWNIHESFWMLCEKRLSPNNKWSFPVTFTLHLYSGLKVCHIILINSNYKRKFLVPLAKNCGLTGYWF